MADQSTSVMVESLTTAAAVESLTTTAVVESLATAAECQLVPVQDVWDFLHPGQVIKEVREVST